MPYNSTTGKITAPVNTDDIAAAIGLASNDVGTLCMSDKVNPDSLCKPIRISTPASTPWVDWDHPGDFAAVTHESDHIVTCGYSIPKCAATEENILNVLGWAQWRRVSIDWCCMDHFIGYNSRVSYEQTPWPIQSFQLVPPNTAMMMFQDVPEDLASVFTVPFFRDMWPGVAVFVEGPVTGSGVNWYLQDIRTQEVVTSEGMRHAQLVFNFSPYEGQKVLAIPFVSDRRINGKSALNAAITLYCSTLHPPMTYSGRIGGCGGLQAAHTAATSVWMEADLQWNGNKRIHAAFKFHNESTSDISGMSGTFTVKEYGFDGAVLRSWTKTMSGMTSAVVAPGSYLFYDFDYDVTNNSDNDNQATGQTLRSVGFCFAGSYSSPSSPSVSFTTEEASVMSYTGGPAL